jgi:hypothetical protein
VQILADRGILLLMSAKHASSSSSAPGAPSGARGNRAFAEVAIASAFLIVSAGYLFLYLGTNLPSLRGEISRAELLGHRVLLPEQAAGHWFGTPPSFTLFDRWPVMITAIGILTLGGLVGRWLLGVERPGSLMPDDLGTSPHITPLERFVFACGVGLNAVSLTVLLVGLAGGLNRWCLLAPAAVIAAISAWHGWRGRSPAMPATQSPQTEISGRWLWLAAPFAATILLGGMLPPLDFDVREYHLQAPKEFFQQGKIGFLPHNVYGNMPLGGEMFSLLAMVWLDDWWLGALAGKTVIAAFSLLTALALFAAGRRFASTGAGVVAAVLYVSIPWVSVVSTSGLIEGVLAFYLFLSVYAVLLWRQTPRHGYLALAGFCSGAAVSCKYPAVLFVALPLVAYVAFTSGKRSWKPVALFSLALLAGCGPWLAKNWALSGNPVYPLLYDWLGGATRTVDINARWLHAHQPHQFSMSALKESVLGVALKSEWLSPVLVPLAAFGLLVRRFRWLALTLGAYFVYTIATWWLFTHRIDRFWIPALPILALLAGLGAAWSTSLAWRRTVLAMLVVGMSISFVFVTAHEVTYNAYFVGLGKARRDLFRVSPWYLILNERVPVGSGVLSVGDAQVFDFAVPVLYNTAFDGSVMATICQDRNPSEIAAELRRRQVSHVFVDWSEIARYRQPGNYGGVPDFITPAWFARLVADDVLESPWRLPRLPGQEVYPVKVPGAAMQTP